ncbi:acetaldehyde dehydrogenase [Klebsiella pneumoniae]|nr:acetaldehyde dehydrogenase [Klebsiella pneumoniae]
MRLMEGQQAVKLTAAQAEQLQPLLLKNIDERGKGTVSRDWVGRDAGKIAAAIGLQVPAANPPAVCGNASQPSVCCY